MRSQSSPLALWPLTGVSEGWDFWKTLVHFPFTLVVHGCTCAGPELCACPGARDRAGELFSYGLISDLLRASQELMCY